MKDSLKIAIIAGEASGDLLGADLMRGLDAEFIGIGGAAMKSEGLASQFPMEELSVMGLVEVLPKLPHLLRRIRETADFVIANQPDVLITIDSPDFCHRVARKVKKARPDLPVIHYVAPSVWAWRAGRAKKMARHVDHVLCLLPFEPDLMRAAGMSADFVGHPIAKMKPPLDLEAWKAKNGEVLAVFPGSRRSEIARHLPIYQEALQSIDFDGKIMIPALDHLEQDIRNALPHAEVFSPRSLGQGEFLAEKSRLMHGARLAIATSGTVSFELAFADCPTLVCYRSSWFNEWLAKRLIRVKWASLANILLEEPLIPELIFENCTPQALAHLTLEALAAPDFAENQKAGFARMREIMTPKIDAAGSVRQFLASHSN